MRNLLAWGSKRGGWGVFCKTPFYLIDGVWVGRWLPDAFCTLLGRFLRRLDAGGAGAEPPLRRCIGGLDDFCDVFYHGIRSPDHFFHGALLGNNDTQGWLNFYARFVVYFVVFSGSAGLVGLTGLDWRVCGPDCADLTLAASSVSGTMTSFTRCLGTSITLSGLGERGCWGWAAWQKRIPYGNDRQKCKSKGNGKGKSGSFALLRMTSFVLVRAQGSCFARFWPTQAGKTSTRRGWGTQLCFLLGVANCPPAP